MIKRSLCLAVGLGLALAIAAPLLWAGGLSDVISTLESPFQAKTAAEFRINDYAANFFQESKIASLDRLQRANGRVEVSFDHHRQQAAAEVRFRWQYEQPTTQQIVSDGTTLWVYLPENNQVIQSDIAQVNQASENDPMAFLTGLGNLSRDFEIGWAVPGQDDDGNYILELTPRRASALINRLVIVVARDAVVAYQQRGKHGSPAAARPSPGGADPWFPILSSAVFDASGNSTIIEFSNLRVNQGLAPSNFVFVIPAGVEVVRPTGEGLGF